MWLVEYDPVARNYLDDSGGLVYPLLLELTRMGMTDDGLPPRGKLTDLGEGLYWWIVAEHSVLLRRSKDRTIVELIMMGEIEGDEDIRKITSPY